MMFRDPRFRLSPQWPWAAAVLVVLLLLTRFYGLDIRPLMHDESLFAYYSYVFMESGSYGHMPIMHGPTLMLSVGSLFHVFGDSIVVGRAFIAVWSIVAIAACLWLVPRRYRWWLALLLITSPVLLFYSRFMRDDLFFNGVLMIGILGITYGLSRRRWRALWLATGLAAVISLLAIMENALFPQVAGITFGLIVLINRWFPTSSVHALLSRFGMMRVPGSLNASNNGSGSAVAASGAAPGSGGGSLRIALPPMSAFLSRERLVTASGWLGGLLGGVLIVTFIYGITLPPEHKQQVVSEVLGQPAGVAAANPAGQPLSGLQNARVMMHLMADSWVSLKASWDYWKGQHEEHRISGPLHFYLPILLTYELPLLLLLYSGIIWDAVSRRRIYPHIGSLVVWVAVWLLWGWVATPTPPGWLDAVQRFLHIGPNGSMMALGTMIVPLLVWAFFALREGRVLAAWIGYWTACSLFQYSVAGEKVPWLAVHIVFPMYLMLVWVWAPYLRRMGNVANGIALTLVVITAVIALRNDFRFMGPESANPRERLVYNHTTPWFDQMANNRLALWSEMADKVPVSARQVILIGDAQWPGIWYFRHTNYIFADSADPAGHANADLVVGGVEVVRPLKDAQPDRWTASEGSLRDHWWAPWPSETRWQIWSQSTQGSATGEPGFVGLMGTSIAQLWQYYWSRELWKEPDGLPSMASTPIMVLDQSRVLH